MASNRPPKRCSRPPKVFIFDVTAAKYAYDIFPKENPVDAKDAHMKVIQSKEIQLNKCLLEPNNKELESLVPNLYHNRVNSYFKATYYKEEAQETQDDLTHSPLSDSDDAEDLQKAMQKNERNWTYLCTVYPSFLPQIDKFKKEFYSTEPVPHVTMRLSLDTLKKEVTYILEEREKIKNKMKTSSPQKMNKTMSIQVPTDDAAEKIMICSPQNCRSSTLTIRDRLEKQNGSSRLPPRHHSHNKVPLFSLAKISSLTQVPETLHPAASTATTTTTSTTNLVTHPKHLTVLKCTLE